MLRLLPARERRGRMVPDPVLHHRIRPNFSGIVQGHPYRANSLGLRDREYPVPPPPGTFRILMLGDSFTEGGGLAVEDTVPRRAEARLAARGCRGHEVVNAGVASYSPILQYLQLREIGPRLQPHLVVLNFDMTDVHDDLIRSYIARRDDDDLPIAVPADRRRETALLLPPVRKPRRLRFLRHAERVLNEMVLYQQFRKSRVGRRLFGPLNLGPDDLFRQGLLGHVRYDRLAITRDRDSASIRRGWRRTGRYLAAIRKLAASQGAGFALVVYPHAHQVSATASPGGRYVFGIGPSLFASERPFEALRRIGSQAGFPVIDVREAFRRRAEDADELFRADDIHHTPEGARVLGEALADGLVERRLLPRCAVSPGGSG